MRFDLVDLRLFLAVLDAGSITHGAADAGLSLAAASERLRGMEADSGVRLLDRGRRGVVPTEAGEALVHHARLVLRQLSRMRGELGEYAKGFRATVRLVANTAALTEFLPQRLGPWMVKNPQIDIDLKERQSADVAKAVASGFAEIGILSDAVKTTGLHLLPFEIDRLVVVAHPGHQIAERQSIAFAEIMDQQFVGLVQGALQDHIEAQAADLGGKLKFRLRLRSFDGICHVAGNGAGIGVVPLTAARRFSRAAKVVVVSLSDNWATRRLSLCVREPEDLTPPARALLAHLAAVNIEVSSPFPV